MSNEWNEGDEAADPADRPTTGPAEGHLPPPPPPGPTSSLPPIEPTLTLQDETEIRRSSGVGARAVAAIIGVVILLAGTVFAVTQSGGSGPGSAEAAVDALLAAAGDEDVLGMMAALDPGERDAMRQPIEDMFGELERLEVLDDSFELSGIAGIDFEFRDVTYRTEQVRDGLARVHFTGGTVVGSIDTDELPIGEFIRDTVARFGGEIESFQETDTSDMGDGGAFLAAVEGPDGWRVSIGYTIAEAARLDSGVAYPTSGAVTPVGADSPEAAVEGMIRAAFDLDLRDAIGRLSPGEFAAMQEYAGLFLPDAERAIASVQDDFDLTLDAIDLRSNTSGDRASVFVDGFALTVDVDGQSFSVAYADECVTLTGDFDQLDPALEEGLAEVGLSLDEPICVDTLEQLADESVAGADPGFEFPEFPELATPEVGITTTRHDGQWFVAPIGTSMDAWVAFLEVLDRETLDAIVDFVEQAVDQFFSAFNTGFPIGEDFTSTGGVIDSEFGEEFEFDPDGDMSFEIVDTQGLFELLETQFPDSVEMQNCFFFELIDADPTVVNEIIAAYPGSPTSNEAQRLLGDTFIACDS